MKLFNEYIISFVLNHPSKHASSEGLVDITLSTEGRLVELVKVLTL